MVNMYAGSINEEGFINSLKRKGFTLFRCISELIQNSIDAKASNISFHVTSPHIDIIDDGCGMNEEKLKNMWDAHRENHSGEESGGVSGLGSKPATYIASNFTDVTIYTKSANDTYKKAYVPWKDIYHTKVYSGKVILSNMNSEEIEIFRDKVESTGTMIRFQYNFQLFNALKTQFENSKSIDDMTQRIGWIFSQFPTEIKYKHQENVNEIVIDKYRYLNDNDDQYYHRKVVLIEVFKMLNGEYVYALKNDENNYTRYVKNARGYQKEPFVNFRTAVSLGTLYVICGMRKDSVYFDYETPELPGASKKLLHYDSQYFSDGEAGHLSGDLIKCDIWYPCLRRNSQNIGPIKSLPKLNPASSRANGQTCLKCHHIRTTVEYSVNSTQDNIMDELMGIQENKNQLNSHNMDVSLLRLIEDCMVDTSNTIWDIFESKINEYNAKIKAEKEEADKLAEALRIANLEIHNNATDDEESDDEVELEQGGSEEEESGGEESGNDADISDDEEDDEEDDEDISDYDSICLTDEQCNSLKGKNNNDIVMILNQILPDSIKRCIV